MAKRQWPLPGSVIILETDFVFFGNYSWADRVFTGLISLEAQSGNILRKLILNKKRLSALHFFVHLPLCEVPFWVMIFPSCGSDCRQVVFQSKAVWPRRRRAFVKIWPRSILIPHLNFAGASPGLYQSRVWCRRRGLGASFDVSRMSDDERRASEWQKKRKKELDERMGQSSSQPFAMEEAVKDTEALIRSLIVEERRRITPSLFPELEPADEDVDLTEDPEDRRERQSLNKSVREILQAERLAGASGQLRSRQSLLSRAFDALRRRPSDRDDMEPEA